MVGFFFFSMQKFKFVRGGVRGSVGFSFFKFILKYISDVNQKLLRIKILYYQDTFFSQLI